MKMSKKVLSLVLFCVLLAVSSVSYSQETSEDYWQEQRDYYQQYQAWELPTEAIVEWLNKLEQSEKDLMLAQSSSLTALSILNPLKEGSEEALKLLEKQQSQLVRQSILTVAAVIAAVIAIFR